MVATLWIRRNMICDMLVYFGSRKDAYDFGIDFLEFHGDASERSYDWDFVTMDEDDCHQMPKSYDMQLSIHDGEFFHAGWKEEAGWAPRGTALVCADEAMELGNTEEPIGFMLEEESLDSYAWRRNEGATVASYWMRKRMTEAECAEWQEAMEEYKNPCSFCGEARYICGEDHADEMRDIQREALRRHY